GDVRGAFDSTQNHGSLKHRLGRGTGASDRQPRRVCWLSSKESCMASDTYHEPLELLSEETRNLHRAIVSLKEELEAIDWYQQRADACSDPALKAVLVHNKNEEIEHASMVLEWIRRHDAQFDAMLKKYLFSS